MTQLDDDIILSTDATLHRMTSVLIVQMQMLHCIAQLNDVTADCLDADAALYYTDRDPWWREHIR